MTVFAILAAALSMSTNGVELLVRSETDVVDPGRSVFLTVSAKAQEGTEVTLPSLEGRLRGFTVADRIDTAEGTELKLIPDPVAGHYAVKPFAVGVRRGAEDLSFVAGPLYFDPPKAAERVDGAMEISPAKDVPPFSFKRLWLLVCEWLEANWRTILWIALAIAVIALLGVLAWWIAHRVRLHLMSPIQRAWLELDKLVSKGLPDRGRYKDFYIELTMVVRRYIQRKYGVKAPHLTTGEFLREIGESGRVPGREKLASFLESADLVKFAGVEATKEMASGATESARAYLKEDSRP